MTKMRNLLLEGTKLKSFSETGFKRLKWVQRGSKEDELLSDDDVVGALHWASASGSLATAETADGKWAFKRVGSVHPRITIREAGKDVDLYAAYVGWGGNATLMLPGQEPYQWAPNIWRSKWILRNNDCNEIMSIELNGAAKINGDLTIRDSSVPTSTLSLLVLLGWYLVMNAPSDNATTR